MARPTLALAPTANPYLFTGQQYDTATGLYSMRARYYDPAVGRFLTQDTYPVDYSNPLELNRYVYVANNPVNATDPSGYGLVSNLKLKATVVGSALSPLYSLGQRAYHWLQQVAIQIQTSFMQAHPAECLLFEVGTGVNVPNCGVEFQSTGVGAGSGGGGRSSGRGSSGDWIDRILRDRGIDAPTDVGSRQEGARLIRQRLTSNPDVSIGDTDVIAIFEANGRWYLGFSPELERGAARVYGIQPVWDRVPNLPGNRHAEANSIREFNWWRLNGTGRGSTDGNLFTSREPCPNCVFNPAEPPYQGNLSVTAWHAGLRNLEVSFPITPSSRIPENPFIITTVQRPTGAE